MVEARPPCASKLDAMLRQRIDASQNLRQKQNALRLRTTISGLRHCGGQRYCIPSSLPANSIGVPLQNLAVKNRRVQSTRRLSTVNPLPKSIAPPEAIRFDRQVFNQECERQNAAVRLRWPISLPTRTAVIPFVVVCTGLPARRQTGLDCQPRTPPSIRPRSRANFRWLSTEDPLPVCCVLITRLTARHRGPTRLRQTLPR